jgi:hypothetical protein
VQKEVIIIFRLYHREMINKKFKILINISQPLKVFTSSGY